MNNLELITKSWFWLEQHKNDEVALGQFVDLLIANKPSLAKYRRKIILFLQKIDYIDPLFNGEIGLGKLEVDGVACCWLWNAYKDKDEYGKFLIENKSDIYPLGKMTYAHRFMLDIITPDFDIDLEEEACHRCDISGCVNPNHLFAGTHQVNMDDMVSKDRQASGSNHPSAKLTDEQAWAIYYDERIQKAIAAEYGVDETTISKIKNGKRKLTDPTKSLPKNQNLYDHSSKVTKEIADEIIRLKATGKFKNVQLAIKFNLSESTIGKILRGKNLKPLV